MSGAGPGLIVGIGASAGGLEALMIVARCLRPEADAAFVVAQHTAPTHKSLLSELIARRCALEVVELDAAPQAPRRGVVYVTPAGADAVLEDGLLRLAPMSAAPGAPKPSIDRLFASLAAGLGPRAAAVVLSGTGSDGARGVRAVREAGGLTIAQDPDTAKYAAMPEAALRTRRVDLTLPPSEIGALFAEIPGPPYDPARLRAAATPKNASERLLTALERSSGVDFRRYKPGMTRRRIAKRMEALGHDSLEAYAERAIADPAELEALFRALLISVTSFFRDPDEFEALRPHLARLLARARTGRGGPELRVWAPGCATGEEAWSLAALIAGEPDGAAAMAAGRVRIFATDIDETALERARRGVYDADALACVPARLRGRFVIRDGCATPDAALRDAVAFARHDVLRDPPYGGVDLLSCRNLLIYFNSRAQHLCLERLSGAMRPDGVLFLGKAETGIAGAGAFLAVDRTRRILQPAPRPETGRRGAALRAVRDALGDAQAHLPADPSARTPAAPPPARRPPDTPPDTTADAPPGAAPRARPERRIAELEGALDASGRSLARATEELSAAYEQLRLVNEELQMGNEELRATNQELQTANEELQASNEELTTVNEELQLRSQQLAEMASHLDAVLRNIASPVLVVDGRLRLSGASAAARGLFDLNEAALAERADLSDHVAPPCFPALAPLFREAMARNAAISREIDCPDAAWSMTVAPFHDAEGALGGAVAVFADQTERRAREARLRDAMEKLTASNAELERFSYVASHDLKEPVRTLAGFAECLGDPELKLDDPERAELLGCLRENARRLGEIIDSLLAFSRIDREVHIEAVDLNEAAREATAFLGRVIADAGAQVEIGPLPTVRASRVHMRQLLQNLIGNAVKFRGDAPCRIVISAQRVGGTHLVDVADNGAGVPEAARAVIFEVFRRLRPRGEVEGAGLGLSICRKIVEQYGGRIWCEDAPGGGAAFRFTLPAR